MANKKDSLQFTNLAFHDAESKQHIVGDEVIGEKTSGILVKKSTIVAFAVLAAVVAALVGIIVHFAVPRNCQAVAPTQSPEEFWQECARLSQEREECLPGAFPCPETTAVPTTVPTPEPPPLVTRLPRNLIPSHYDIHLKPDIYLPSTSDFNTVGHVTMHVECREETDLVAFHYDDMDVDNTTIQVRTASNQLISISRTDDVPVDHMFKIYLSRQLTVGEDVTVYIEFHYRLLSSPKNGLHWNDYPENGEIKYMLATQFEPARARRAFPCLDEPNLKATFKTTIMRKKWMTALTNSPLTKSIEMEDDWVEDRFETTAVVMPTYLLAFAVANFTHTESVSSGGLTTKPIRYWAEPRYVSAGFTEYAMQISGPGYDFFEEHFDHPYKMPKTDQIQVPDFASGAMENWGLITYVGSRLLFDKDVSQEYEKQRALGTIMHELLHQWLGNVVTCDWWSDIWLNEAFARFYQHMAMKVVEPTWDVDQIYAIQSVQRALAYDQTGTRHPIYNPYLRSTADFSMMFTSISYDKGGAVLRMTEKFVMKDSWNASMRYYIDKHQYKTAAHDDLFIALEEQLAKDNRLDDLEVNVTEYMYTWIKQSGYPVVKVERQDQGDTTHISATQKLFLVNDRRELIEKYPPPYNYTWEIPLSYITKNDINDVRVEWMHKTDKTFDIGMKLPQESWILANYKQFGIYRVNYDDGNWASLASQLSQDHKIIHVLSRGQLIDDAFYLARAEQLPVTTALELTKYLGGEYEYLPWYSSWTGLSFIETIFSSDHKYIYLRNYMRAQLEYLYGYYGWDIQDGESHPSIYIHEMILQLACKYQVGDCVDVATRKFADWKQNPSEESKHINPNVKDAVYCTAIAHGSEGDWDFLLEQYIKYKELDHFSSHRAILRTALCCSRERWILDRFLRMAIDRDRRLLSSDINSILDAIARNPNGNLLAWEYMNSVGTPYIISRLLAGTIASYSTDYDLQKVQKFFDEHKDVGLDSTFESAKMMIEQNIRWRNANEDDIFKWFNEQTKAPEPDPDRLRLPLTLLPEHYDIVLRPDIYQEDSAAFTFNGSVTIHLRCEAPTAVITVHFRQMAIDRTSIMIVTDGEQPLSMMRAEIVEDLEFYKIHTNRVIQEGEKIEVFIRFSAPLGNSQAGMYWSDYPEDGQTKYMVATQFEASDARKAFPCLDEPALKASFNVTLFRKSWMVALTNGPLSRSISHDDDWVEDIFEKTTVVMPTYLIAFAIANYTYVEDTATGGLTEKYVRFFAEPRYISAGFAEYAKTITAPSYDFFETVFDYPYEMQKTDQIQVPDFAAGAMENWGLITYRGARLLVDPELTSEYEKQRMAGTVYHELLHQWIGNIVTCAWWSDIWLNEAFARYYQHWALRHVNSDWDIDQIYSAQSIFRALDYDSSGTRHPIHNPMLVKASDFDAMFTANTYDKGGIVLRMAHNFIMKDSWNASMQYYIKKMAYKAAEHDDLFTAWEEQLVKDNIVLEQGVNVTEFMYTWIKQMGYPVVTMRRETPTRISATQRMFLLDPERPLVEKYPPPYSYTWEVPIAYVTNFGPNEMFTEWLHRENRSIDLSVSLGDNDWILANYRQLGLFRVNYDEKNWNALINQLDTNFTAIDVLNRGQLLDDAFNLARAGELESMVALKLSRYMTDERGYTPWYAARAGLYYLERILEMSPHFIDFRTYIRNLVTPAYDDFGWEEQAGDSHPKIYLRELILRLACKFGHEGCVDKVKQIMTDWMNDSTNKSIVRPDVRIAVFCTALENGGEAEWDFLFSQYQIYKENDHFSSYRINIRDALACSRQAWILNRYFLMALEKDERILSGDRASIMTGIARNPIGNSIARGYLLSRESEISQSLFSVVAESYSTEYDLQQTVHLLQQSNLPSSTQESIQRIISANIRWREANEESIFSWLSEKN